MMTASLPYLRQHDDASGPPDRQRRRLIGAALLAAALPAVAAPTRPDKRTALVLGGGGCRGYGHIGVLKVLAGQELWPDLVVGSSAGSLVGALYAAGIEVAEIAALGERLSPNLLRDWIFPRLGLFGGGGIRRFVNARLGGARDFAELPRSFAAVATDLLTGEMVVLDRGEVGLAVQASSSIPGLVEPVTLDGRTLVDGNISAPVPVEAARRLGATHVLAVDVSFPPEEANLADPFDALYQSFSILTRRIAMEERDRADVVIVPALPPHQDMKPATLQALIEAGEAAAMAVLPRIRALLARPRS